MKSWAVKLGKAINALKQEGLVLGGRRAIKSFFAQFGRVRPGDILFITGGIIGASTQYRVHNQMEELRLHGLRCSATLQDNPFLPKYADRFKIFVFHRVLHTSSVAKLIEKIKKNKGEIIFETDDLVFDSKYFKHIFHLEKMNWLEKQQFQKGLGEEIFKDPYVKICVTTTSYLKKILEGYGKKVFVSTNKLSNKDLEIINKLLKNKIPKVEPSKIKVGYFSGTKGHDKNFATVEDTLVEIIEKYSNVKLVLAGPLNISDKFSKFRDRIERLVFVPRKEHFKNIAGVDINIIPLEKDNPFCESKSELKFFEAGILGVPSAAVDNQTYRETIEDGVDGFLAGNVEEWREKLEKLILDPELRAAMGEKAREKVLRNYTNKNSHNEEYYSYLRSKISG